MRSIVRRDTGETYEEYLTGLAKASGVRTPTRAALARLDRRRAKKGSNEDWKSPSDPDAKITKMKDGRTHLAHKAEHAVDVESGAIVAVTVQDASTGDTGTIMETLAEAEGQLVKLQRKAALEALVEGMQEVVADKGYHSDDVLVGLEEVGLRSYLSEPDRGRRRWQGDESAQRAVYANRRRTRGERGQRLQRTRGERVERSFAHLYETGQDATDAPARSLEHPQAAADSRECLQSRPTAPRSVRDRDSEGPAGPSSRLLRLLLRLYRLLRPVLLAHKATRDHAVPHGPRSTPPFTATPQVAFRQKSVAGGHGCRRPRRRQPHGFWVW